MIDSALFSHATRVARAYGDNWHAHIAPGWDILGATDGGYLLAIAGRALAQATGRDPVSVTGHFLSPGKAGLATIQTSIVKAGSTFTTASAVMRQGERPVLTVLGSFGPLLAKPDVLLQKAEPPQLPDPESLQRMRSDHDRGMPPPFMDRIDLRLHPDDVGFTRGNPSGEARMRGWWRPLDGEAIDPVTLLLAADTLPPTTFNAGLPVTWTPTLELTVHVRAIPGPGWLRLDFGTRFISHGRLEIDGLIWDSNDQLVAQSRQLALVPRRA